MRPLSGIAAVTLALVAAALVGLAAGYLIGALLLAAPLVIAWRLIPRRRPRPGPTPR